MERDTSPTDKDSPPQTDPAREKAAAEKLSKPPKDKTGVIIAPNKGTGPDVSLD